MKSTRGFGFTVKWRKRLTTSLSVRILDWAGPEGIMTRPKDKDQGLEAQDVYVCVCFLTVNLQCRFVCLPAANSSMVMRGKRMSVRALPRTLRLFSGVGCSCCL